MAKRKKKKEAAFPKRLKVLTAVMIVVLIAGVAGVKFFKTTHGRIILLDPFHTLTPLARVCRISGRRVVDLFTSEGLKLLTWSGLHFIPARLLLARRPMERFPAVTRLGYRFGESVLRLAPRTWGDYGLFVFHRES